MPTDLPPDYKPEPLPGDGKAPPATPKPQGEDAKDPTGPGVLGEDGDVVNPPGWKQPPSLPGEPAGVPTPAGTPTF